MNLATLKQVCAAYHGKKVEELTDENTDVDLFLVAANNARKSAERDHNFESTWMLATLSVAPTTGGALSAVTIAPTGVFSGVREIISVEGTINGCRSPLTIRRPNQGVPLNIPRIPTDAQAVSCGCSYLIRRGNVIYKFPDDGTGTAFTIYLEAYGWLNDYTDAMLLVDAATPDFLVEHGFEFLQWSIILELNYTFQTFVFRQEGNPGAPEKLKAAAWESLLRWDSYQASHFADDR